eukprot:Skav222205  [mRNA]  locus=scaffold3943:41172:42716:+ [translate_table: standard]
MNVQGRLIPWISPKAWLQYIVSHGLLYMLSGLQFEDRHLIGTTWKQFWQQFQPLFPDFGIFDDLGSFDPTHTIAMYLHGDEGRTLKRSAVMVTSIQSALGVGFNKKRLKRPQGSNDIGKLWANFAGHTFTTRFVMSVIGKKDYATNPTFFHDSMECIALELRDLLSTGLRDPTTGEIWRFVLIGIKGDQPFLQKIGMLKRSWNTAVKRGTQRAPPRGVCHYCLAGTNQFPAEDTAHDPVWLPTLGAQPPWDVTPPMLRILPHFYADPGSFLHCDLWHSLHLGVLKSFIASTLQISLEVIDAPNNDERYEIMTEHYHNFCRMNKTSSLIGKITGYLISHGDGPGAVGNWSKGALSTNLSKWLVVFLDELPDDAHKMLSKCKQALKQLNSAMSFLYNAPLFLEKPEGQYIYHHGMHWIQTYSMLARKCYSLKRPHLFPLMPKLHSVHHCFLAIRLQCERAGYGISPLASSCQMDEDCIGRVARTTRRVNARLMVRRTLERHLIACWKVWHDAGLLR